MGILAHFILPFRFLVTVAVSWPDFGVPSLQPIIPFPARRGWGGRVPYSRLGILAVLGAKNVVRTTAQLLWVQPEGLELLAPFGRRIAQPFDADASRQPTFDGCSNEVRCEES